MEKIIRIDDRSGLVLEGLVACAASSLAVCSTALWIHGIRFPYTIGVSAGAWQRTFLYVRPARACQVQ